MTKLAVFQIVSSGIDGRGEEVISYASLYEENRNREYESLEKNKCYYSKKDSVLDLQLVTKKFMQKLNGLDRMILECAFSFDSKSDSITFPFFDQNVELWKPKK